MKKAGILVSIFLLPLFVFGQELTELEINPDFLKTNKHLDSVLRYTFSSQFDSSLMHKWDYRIDEQGLNQSNQYTWRDSAREWFVTDMYKWAYNGSDKLILKAHYDWPMSNGGWGGCDSEGCGKKEWAYDENGNQILWTQSYYSPARKWEIFEKYENVFDHNNNLVLNSVLTKAGSYSDFWWDGKKDEYSYDENGNQTGHVRYTWANYYPFRWRQYSDWCPLYKEEIEYNQFRDTTSRAFFVWDYKANKWICDVYTAVNRIEFQYDAEDRNIGVTALHCDSILFQNANTYNDIGLPINCVRILENNLIDELGFFDDMSYVYNNLYDPVRVEYEYDSLNRVITEKRYIWRRSSAFWDHSKTIYLYYDSEGRLIEYKSLRLFRTSTERQLHTREQWSYNQSGLITIHTSQYRSGESEDWIPDMKEEKSYDNNERLILDAYYTWDEDSNDWTGRKEEYWNGVEYNTSPGKFEYKYDDADNLILYALYSWSDRRNDWIGYEQKRGKKEWEYDSEGRVFMEIGYDWENESLSWIAKQQNVFQYDDIGDPVKQYQYAWEPDQKEWVRILVYHYYYSLATGIKNIANNIGVYPNPTTGIINITGLTQPAKFKLYSIQGQMLKTEQQVQSTIDISDLPSGVYYLNLISGDTVLRKTIIRK